MSILLFLLAPTGRNCYDETTFVNPIKRKYINTKPEPGVTVQPVSSLYIEQIFVRSFAT